MVDGLPSLPVSGLPQGTAVLAVRPVRRLQALDDSSLADLVRLRLRLERSHGWVLLGCIALALATVIAVGLTVDSRTIFGVYAAAVATASVVLGFAADAVSRAIFLRGSRDIGLDDGDSERLFLTAREADHWVNVLSTCGEDVSDHELAAFVRRNEPDDNEVRAVR